MVASLVFYSNSELLEGPVFDKNNKYLYFVSILEGLFYCYTPMTKKNLNITLDFPTGCIFLWIRKKNLSCF